MGSLHQGIVKSILVAASVVCASAGSATAFELCGGAGEAITRAPAYGWDFGVGLSLMSDLIERGISETNHKPTFEAQAEAAFGLAYLGVSATRLGDGAEFGAALGVRPQFGNLALDIGVSRSKQTGEEGESETEFYAAGLFGATDRFSLGGEVNVGRSGERCLQGIATLDLGGGFEASAEFGRVSFREAGLVDYFAWAAGLSYELNDWATVDLRYSATDLSKDACETNTESRLVCGARVMLGVTVSTSLAKRSQPATGRDDD